jgi:cytidylate kinase
LPRPNLIAIDGPAGSGKSTISERLAQQYAYIFVDTGAFYRAMTYVILQAGVALEDEAAVAEIVRAIRLEFTPDAQSGYRVLANGQDVSDQLRTTAVESAVSAVAKMPIVRQGLLPLQREAVKGGGFILAGRDIGTVVLPDAELKIYLDASLEERARRRHLQSGAQAYEEVAADLARRDKTDSERSLAPLTRAEDAILILTDGKTIDEVVAEIAAYLQ